MDQLLQRARAFRAWFLALEPARRLWLLAIGGLGLAGLVIAWQVATYERLVPVVDTPMDTTTTHAIVEHLKSIDEVYDVEEGTGRVLVRDHRVADLRVSLGGQGLVSDKTVGLELFEESRFGSTRFVEHIRYVRGLQGEVERALNSFDSVRSWVCTSSPITTSKCGWSALMRAPAGAAGGDLCAADRRRPPAARSPRSCSSVSSSS